jgi:pilus assembly protein CpaB
MSTVHTRKEAAPLPNASLEAPAVFDPKTLAQIGRPADAGRRRRFDLHALGLALVAAVLAGTLFVLYLRRLEVETRGGPPIRVLMTVKPLANGATITEDALAVRSVPQAYVEGRAIREGDRARILGLKVDFPLKTQQTLLWTDLSLPADDRHKLSEVLQAGMRAVSIRPSTDDEHFFALLRPGDRVDIVANLPHPTIDHQRIATFIAQNVLVLAVGQDMGPGAAARPPHGHDAVLTLSVTPQQVQLLSLASERGKLGVAVRPRSGSDTIDSPELSTANANAILFAEGRERPGPNAKP